MHVRQFLGLMLFCGTAVIATFEDGAARVIGPEDHLCRAINDPVSRDELELRPGDYHGPCMIRRGGTQERPLVIRAQDPEHPPRILYDGAGANVMEVRADHVVLQGLAFGPTQKHVDAIRIRAQRDVAVRDCRFSGLGGIAVVANQSSVQGLRVSGNVITQVHATAMYFGCHDGTFCRVSDLLIERNYIDGVSAAENEVGYGIQVKLNSTATIRDNAIRDTKGPGIMVYGSRDDGPESVIERNFVSGSRTSSGIVIGGGPALVQNNIAVGNAAAGIALHDYGQWGLLRRVRVGFNTLVQNHKAAVSAAPSGMAESFLVGNVSAGSAERMPFPPNQYGLSVSDNLMCDRSCFANLAELDFAPARGSRLDQHAITSRTGWLRESDFFGQRRQNPPRPGAVETAGRSALHRSAP